MDKITRPYLETCDTVPMVGIPRIYPSVDMRGSGLFLPQMYVRGCEIDVTIDLQSGIMTGL